MKAVCQIAVKTETGVSDQPHGVIKDGEVRIDMVSIELPLLRVEIHESEIPWLKLFVKRKVREFSACTSEEKQAVWIALDIIEKTMLLYYRPEKINIASFGNMLPQVHWHIMARFKEDSFFPEPMWGKPQRVSSLSLREMAPFMDEISQKLHRAMPA